eukprot:5724588-Amphidinium_carterae.1
MIDTANIAAIPASVREVLSQGGRTRRVEGDQLLCKLVEEMRGQVSKLLAQDRQRAGVCHCVSCQARPQRVLRPLEGGRCKEFAKVMR